MPRHTAVNVAWPALWPAMAASLSHEWWYTGKWLVDGDILGYITKFKIRRDANTQ